MYIRMQVRIIVENDLMCVYLYGDKKEKSASVLTSRSFRGTCGPCQSPRLRECVEACLHVRAATSQGIDWATSNLVEEKLWNKEDLI